jgi:hypothetical protein
MPTTLFDFLYKFNSESAQNEEINAVAKSRVKEFMPSSYFFTEGGLTAQTASSDAYGPIDSSSFRITTRFGLTNKKAFAVTSGQVLVLPQTGSQNAAKVNVIIKPLKNIDVGIPIKYFIYRGLKKNMFVNGLDILESNDSTNTPFMKKVWADLKTFNNLVDPLPNVPAALFGYNETEADTITIDQKFFNLHDETTANVNKNYSLAIIEAGQYFGDFFDNGGFEIVLDDGAYYQENPDTGFVLDLSYGRSDDVLLDVAHIIGSPNVSEKIYRENVQKFLDPAAFYGAHINEKENGEIKVINTPDTNKYSTRSDIYEYIVSKFYNKNKFYLYIQAERGRSYNFDDVLGTNPIKIGVAESVAPSSYLTNNWPIIIREVEQTHTAEESDAKKMMNNVSFQLKFGTPEKILSIYNNYGNCANGDVNGDFLLNESLIAPENIPTQDYTNMINYRLINTYSLLGSTALTVKSIASFIFITSNEKKQLNYFNDFFGPINIEPLIKPSPETSNVIQKSVNQNLKIQYWGLDNTSASQFGMIFNGLLLPPVLPAPPVDNRTRLYVLKKLSSTDPLNREFNSYASQDAGYGVASNADEYGTYVYGNKNYKVWKGKITDASDTIESLQLVNLDAEGNVTNFMSFGLTEIEFNRLIYNSDTVAAGHIPTGATNFFFHIDETSLVEGTNYQRYKMGIKYDPHTGASTIVYPSVANTVYVYTVDGYYFFTKGFTEKFEFAEKFADVEINFRTLSTYTGEFGFDWLRIGDNGEAFTYEQSIISGYEQRFGTDTNTFYDTPPEAYQALRKEYINLPLQRNNQMYYVPYLNIYPITAVGTPIPPSTVTLKARVSIVDFDLLVTKYDLEYDKTLFTVSLGGTFPEYGPISYDVNMTVTCLKEFDKDQYIKVIATGQMPGLTPTTRIAGIVKVCKNSRLANRREQKIVMISVKTNITSTAGGIKTGTIYGDEVAILSNSLYQCFVYARVTNPLGTSILLDLSGDPKFQVGGHYINNGGIYRNITDDVALPEQGVFVYLNNKFHAQTGNIYKNYFTVFMFGVRANNPFTVGRVQDIGKKSVALFSTRSNNLTLSHETLHGLGLYHTHADGMITSLDQKYTYPNHNDPTLLAPNKPKATDNIMSYSGPIRKSTWKWQWKIMVSRLKKF